MDNHEGQMDDYTQEGDIHELVMGVLAGIDDHEIRNRASLVNKVIRRILPDKQFAELRNAGLFEDEGRAVAYCLRQFFDSLQDVNLSGNCRLGDAGLESICGALLDAPRLASLDISNCGFLGRNIPSLLELIKNSTVLKTLILDWNKVTAHFMNGFGPALTCNTNLVRLSMRGVAVDMIESADFPLLRSLKRHPTLKHVYMDRGVWEIDTRFGATRLAEVFAENNVLETVHFDNVPTTEVCFGILCRALYHNTTLQSLRLGRVIRQLDQPVDVVAHVDLLLAENVTLAEFGFDCVGHGTRDFSVHSMVKRNMVRKCSRTERTRQAIITLEGVRRFRCPLSLRYIDRDIMRMVGKLILASQLRPEWEDPALWPVGQDGEPLRAVANPSPTKRPRPSLHVGARIGPWRMNAVGEWERVEDDDNEG